MKNEDLKLKGKPFNIPCEDCAKMIKSNEAVISAGKFKPQEFRCKDCSENNKKPSGELLEKGMKKVMAGDDDKLTDEERNAVDFEMQRLANIVENTDNFLKELEKEAK